MDRKKVLSPPITLQQYPALVMAIYCRDFFYIRPTLALHIELHHEHQHSTFCSSTPIQFINRC